MTDIKQPLAKLPGQTREDAGLIDETVAELNAAVDRGGLTTMRELARIVLDKMFRDDAGAFLRAEDSHASYLGLVRHPNLRVSRTGIWYAIAIDALLREFGGVGDRLTLTHLKRLVHVPDAALRQNLAERAGTEHWSVMMLEAEIERSQPARPADAPRIGRPPMPPQVKRFAKVERAVQSLREGALDDMELDEASVRELLGRADAAQQELAVWVQALRSRVDG